MKGFAKVATTADLKPGQMKLVQVERENILLANIDGRFYALSNDCTHAGGFLSYGVLQGQVLECPVHGSQFNVTTGQVVREPASDPLTCYSVREEGADILVGPG